MNNNNFIQKVLWWCLDMSGCFCPHLEQWWPLTVGVIALQEKKKSQLDNWKWQYNFKFDQILSSKSPSPLLTCICSSCSVDGAVEGTPDTSPHWPGSPLFAESHFSRMALYYSWTTAVTTKMKQSTFISISRWQLAYYVLHRSTFGHRFLLQDTSVSGTVCLCT